MSITTDLDAWWAELSDYTESNTAKAKLQDIMTTIDQMLDELQTMNTNGDFDQLPASCKAKAIWMWAQLDNARDTIKADADAMEFIGWRP